MTHGRGPALHLAYLLAKQYKMTQGEVITRLTAWVAARPFSFADGIARVLAGDTDWLLFADASFPYGTLGATYYDPHSQRVFIYTIHGWEYPEEVTPSAHAPRFAWPIWTDDLPLPKTPRGKPEPPPAPPAPPPLIRPPSRFDLLWNDLDDEDSA